MKRRKFEFILWASTGDGCGHAQMFRGVAIARWCTCRRGRAQRQRWLVASQKKQAEVDALLASIAPLRVASRWRYADLTTTTRVRKHNGRPVGRSAYVASGRWIAWHEGVDAPETFESQAAAESYVNYRLRDSGWAFEEDMATGP